MCTLFSAGAAAVRNYNSAVKIVIHETNPEKQTLTKWAAILKANEVDYDVLATSYYPYWHGTLANLKSEFETVKTTYGKDVMVAETSYAYTLDDSDGHTNTVRVGNNDDSSQTNCTEPFTVQGQATSIRNLINTVSEAGGLGVFYWEPAWITVGDTTGLTGDTYDKQVAANKTTWETYGSGWASSFSSEYDPTDAGKWYGGSAVDNEAMFAADGTPLASLNVWNYVRTGAVNASVSVDAVGTTDELSTSIRIGEDFSLPKTITVSYNSGSVSENVEWNEADKNAVSITKTGTYEVKGSVSLSKGVTSGTYAGQTEIAVTFTLTVLPKNLIEDAKDAGFEKGENFTAEGSALKKIPSTENPYSGDYSMSWWSQTATSARVTYNKEISLEAGSYVFEAMSMGSTDEKVTLQVLDTEDNVLYEGDATALQGYNNWQIPKTTFTLEAATTVKLRVYVEILDGGWGSVDDLYLYELVEESSEEPKDPDPSPQTPAVDTVTSSGTTTETTTETTTKTTTNAAGKEVTTTTTVKTDADGNVTGSREVSVIADVAKNTTAKVTVNKTADGEVSSASASVTKTGTASGDNTKLTISAAVTAQITEAAGTDDVAISVKAVDASGATKYTVKVNAQDLTAGTKLYIYKLDTKTGAYTMVNSKTYTVSAAGNVSVSLDKKATYELVDAKTAKAIDKAILATVKTAKSSATVKAGKKTSLTLSSKLNKANVKSITYTTSKKSVATVSKSGKVTAKKAGTATVKAKVTLLNGKTKTVTMKVKVK
jgi:arabinogalactan endo-1,4-beta-galactosidase